MARSVGGDLKHAQIVRPGAVLGSVSSAWTAGPAAIAATGVRQGQGRQLPLGRRQAAARRRLRLRRRLRHASPWAAQLYNDAIARGKDHPHATRTSPAPGCM